MSSGQPAIIYRKGLDLKAAVAGALSADYDSSIVESIKADGYRYGAGRPDEAAFARMLLDAGANPKAQASLRREVQYDDKRFVHEHRDATPLTWGRDFPYKLLVSRRAMQLVEAAAPVE